MGTSQKPKNINHFLKSHPIGNGCTKHADCETCPYPDCIAKPTDITRYMRLEKRRQVC